MTFDDKIPHILNQISKILIAELNKISNICMSTTITDLPNFAIYVCAMDTLHKSVGLTVGMRVGRRVSHVRDATSV